MDRRFRKYVKMFVRSHKLRAKLGCKAGSHLKKRTKRTTKGWAQPVHTRNTREEDTQTKRHEYLGFNQVFEDAERVVHALCFLLLALVQPLQVVDQQLERRVRLLHTSDTRK